MTPAEYSREIESYLCRKNNGHLIRIVGPVFEKVCGWATQGVPLRIAFQGIDRYFERRQAKGPAAMRRPARVEFCEADILDAFDAWRRAVGVVPGSAFGEADGRAQGEGAANGAATHTGAAAAAGANVDGDGDADGHGDAFSEAKADGRVAGGRRSAADPAGGRGPSSDRATGGGRRKTSLQTHIDRVLARLTQRRVEAGVSTALAEAIDRLLTELDMLRAGAKGARQEARAEIVARLASLDVVFIESARVAVDDGLWQSAERDAREELDPFRARMDESTYAHALRAATERTFRSLARLPSVRVDD